MTLEACYKQSKRARLHWDKARSAHFLLYPERGLALNHTAAAVWKACDGRTSARSIAHTLAAEFGVAPEMVERDVQQLVDALLARGLLIQTS
jgi:coenzyme PQQ biosynthesis protein PqqD